MEAFRDWLQIPVIVSLLAITISPVYADGFRCNTKLVMTGDTTSEVKRKCGQPNDETIVGYVKVDDEYVNLTRYTYDLGAGKFLRILEFHNGKLVEVSDGPRS